MWFQIELPEAVRLTEIQFESPGRGGRGAPRSPAFPLRSKVEVSMDGKAWSAPVADGEGTGTSTVIAFPPVRAKFVRITQTATVEGAPNWSIQRLRLFEVQEGE
jgi:hypothetical protein